MSPSVPRCQVTKIPSLVVMAELLASGGCSQRRLVQKLAEGKSWLKVNLHRSYPRSTVAPYWNWEQIWCVQTNTKTDQIHGGIVLIWNWKTGEKKFNIAPTQDFYVLDFKYQKGQGKGSTFQLGIISQIAIRLCQSLPHIQRGTVGLDWVILKRCAAI